MTRKEVLATVAAVLTTALETEPAAMPASAIYVALGSDYSKWESIRDLMHASGLVTLTGSTVRLTAKGRETAEKCNAILAS